MPEYPLPWETLGQEYATNLATPVDIMVDASNGASDYGNYTVLSVCLSFCVCVYLPVYLSACVSVCLSACLSTCDVARSLFLHKTVDKSIDRKKGRGRER